jgi:hypothetical protein
VEGTKKIKSVAALRKAGIAVIDIGERIEHAGSMDALEALQDEFKAVLRGAVMGLQRWRMSLSANRLPLRRDMRWTMAPSVATGWMRSGLATNSCAMKSQCAARACDGMRPR